MKTYLAITATIATLAFSGAFTNESWAQSGTLEPLPSVELETITNGTYEDTIEGTTTSFESYNDTSGSSSGVAASPLVLIKTAALDEDCDGVEDAPYTTTGLTPGDGQCLLWKLEVKNNGLQTLCNLNVQDRAPRGISNISLRPYIVRQPGPAQGSCSTEADTFSCVVGNQLDSNGDGVQESNCLRTNEVAEIKYGIVIR